MSKMPLPLVQSVVLADHVYVDQATSKCVIAGTFNRIWSATFPNTFHGPSFLYVCLTGIRAKTELEVRLTDLETSHVIMTITGFGVEGADPLEFHELAIQVPGFPLPHAGAYSLALFSGGLEIGAKKIEMAKRDVIK